MSEIKFFQQVINILLGTADILLRILCYLVFILSASWAGARPRVGLLYAEDKNIGQRRNRKLICYFIGETSETCESV